MIGAAIEVSGWPRDAPHGRAVLGAADLVVATGRSESMAGIERLVPDGARLVLHGPRLSAAVVTRSALEADFEGWVGALADDVAFAGQAGCLSPVVAWVEGGGEELLERAARGLPRALARAGQTRERAGRARRMGGMGRGPRSRARGRRAGRGRRG